MDAQYSLTGGNGRVHVQSYEQLADALGNRDAATFYVELGGRSADWLLNVNWQSVERAYRAHSVKRDIPLVVRYPIRNV